MHFHIISSWTFFFFFFTEGRDVLWETGQEEKYVNTFKQIGVNSYLLALNLVQGL